MAKLVDTMKENQVLNRRQLPLVIDENLTMVLDLSSLNIICDNASMRGKQLEDFMKKYKILNLEEISDAFQVTLKQLVDILNQTIPCIGCRKSVERVFVELSVSEYPALSPLVIRKNGILTIASDYFKYPNHLCSLLHGHSTKLNNLASSWPRSKKSSRRCVLHSLDTQRYTRPMSSAGWRDIWDCMRNVCKEQVVLIEACVLLETLETYLRKHRFCGECRTKVMKAYTLLVEEKDPMKEKGYVPALYLGIKRCLCDKHIHLDLKTDFIAGLISRAEPELIGNRRERHAKTLEIAQEEVLTCIGICVYERLHKIHMKVKEETSTYQVLATAAIDALCRNFEMVVEEKQGVSQLELCYRDMIKEDQLKLQRRELKKLKKRKRREERKIQLMKLYGKENYVECECDDEEEEEEELVDEEEDDSEDNDHDGTEEEENSDQKDDDEEEEEEEEEIEEVHFEEQIKTKNKKNRKANNNNNNNNDVTNNNGGSNNSPSKLKLRKKSYKNESVDTDDNCACDQCCIEIEISKKKTTQKNNKKNIQKLLKTNNNNTTSTTITSSKTLAVNNNNNNKKPVPSKNQQQQQQQKQQSPPQQRQQQQQQQNGSVNIKEQQKKSIQLIKKSNNNNMSNVLLRNNNNNNTSPKLNKKSKQQQQQQQQQPNCDGHSNVSDADIGYNSGNNSTLSSPASSEVACSDGFCNHDGPEECSVDNTTSSTRSNLQQQHHHHQQQHHHNNLQQQQHHHDITIDDNNEAMLYNQKLSLEEMLNVCNYNNTTSNSGGRNGGRNGTTNEDDIDDDDDDENNLTNSFIPIEEVENFKAKIQNVDEIRKQLRKKLQQSFLNLCNKSKYHF